MVTMESDAQKYQRWLDGKEKAKKMWFAKYQRACRERDRYSQLWRQANARFWMTIVVASAAAFVAGFAVGVEFALYKVFGGR